MSNDKIEKVGPAALARPAFIPEGDIRGTEQITKDQLQMPRLALAQALSPELSDGDAKYIEGLKVGDAFNNLTGEVYGKKPLEVVVVRVDAPRWVEFFPREAGGGIKDINISGAVDDEATKRSGRTVYKDPRLNFSTDKDGNTMKPVATMFVEMIALLGEHREPIALSFKSAGLKTARQLSSLIKLRVGLPSFSSVFVLTPTLQKNAKGSFSVFNVRFRGNVDEQTYKLASQFYESVKDRVLAVDEHAADDDANVNDKDVPF